MAITFPAGAAGAEYTNPTTGVKYYWDTTDEVWKTHVWPTNTNYLQLSGGTLTGDLSLGTNDLTAQDITTTGAVSVGTGLTVGNGLTVSDGNVVMAAGHGIDFSADGNGRAGSVATNELLADYEEGTWTPTLGGNATASAGTMAGHYIKVGNVVHAAFNLTNSTIAGSHNGYIFGLPYTNNGHRAGGFGVNSFNSMSSADQTCGVITDSAAEIILLRNVASSAWTVVGITAGSNRYLHLVCTYRAEP